MAPVLGYWKLRGIAQPIRLLLNHVGQEFEEKTYECGPAPDFDRSSWTNEKTTLGFDFPNLPYYIDGDLKLTQSTAILRYLADQHDLNGTTEQEKARVYMVEYEVADFRMEFVKLCYSPNFDQMKEDFKKNFPARLKALADFLGDHDWLAGAKLTYVDFMFYETLDHHRMYDAELFKGHNNLKNYMIRFEALPRIRDYMASDRFIKSPINNKMAKFGNV